MKMRAIIHDFQGREHLVTVEPGETFEAVIPVKIEDTIIEAVIAKIEFLGVFDDGR